MLSRPSQFAHLVVIFLSVWIPFTIYWANLPSDSWLTSPLWNSWYLFLISAVVLVGWCSKDDSVHLGSLVMLCVFALSRAIYGTEPEYLWVTPMIDGIAGGFCWHIRQRVIASVFLLMVAHFLIAKFTGVPAWRWQLRNNLLFMIQCFIAIGLWSWPLLRSKLGRSSKQPPPDNVMRLVPREDVWPRIQNRG